MNERKRRNENEYRFWPEVKMGVAGSVYGAVRVMTLIPCLIGFDDFVEATVIKPVSRLCEKIGGAERGDFDL